MVDGKMSSDSNDHVKVKYIKKLNPTTFSFKIDYLFYLALKYSINSTFTASNNVRIVARGLIFSQEWDNTERILYLTPESINRQNVSEGNKNKLWLLLTFMTLSLLISLISMIYKFDILPGVFASMAFICSLASGNEMIYKFWNISGFIENHKEIIQALDEFSEKSKHNGGLTLNYDEIPIGLYFSKEIYDYIKSNNFYSDDYMTISIHDKIIPEWKKFPYEGAKSCLRINESCCEQYRSLTSDFNNLIQFRKDWAKTKQSLMRLQSQFITHQKEQKYEHEHNEWSSL